MDVINLFEDALKYPTNDFNKILTLGALALILAIPLVLIFLMPFLFSNMGAISVVAVLIGIVTFILVLLIEIIYAGYGLNIIKKTIALEEGLPEFEWASLILDGIKVIVLTIAYFIIPWILTFVMSYLIVGLSVSIGDPSSLIFANLFLFLIMFILFIPFGLLLSIALGKLAETGSLSAAINVIDVFDKIGQIGWSNYIIWIIVYLVINFILGIILSIISIIPLIGTLIALILFVPYILMYSSRALGLIYNEREQ